MCSAVYAFPYLAQEPQEKNKHQAGENQRPLEVTGGGVVVVVCCAVGTRAPAWCRVCKDWDQRCLYFGDRETFWVTELEAPARCSSKRGKEDKKTFCSHLRSWSCGNTRLCHHLRFKKKKEHASGNWDRQEGCLSVLCPCLLPRAAGVTQWKVGPREHLRSASEPSNQRLWQGDSWLWASGWPWTRPGGLLSDLERAWAAAELNPASSCSQHYSAPCG